MVTLEELKAGRLKVARIIKIHGERFMPLFTELDKEIQQRESQESDLDRVLRMASAA